MANSEKDGKRFSDPITDWSSNLMNAALIECKKAESTLPAGVILEGFNATFQKRDKIFVSFVFTRRGGRL